MKRFEQSQFFFMCIDASQYPVFAIMVNGIESVNKNIDMQKPRTFDLTFGLQIEMNRVIWLN